MKLNTGFRIFAGVAGLLAALLGGLAVCPSAGLIEPAEESARP